VFLQFREAPTGLALGNLGEYICGVSLAAAAFQSVLIPMAERKLKR
jgi:hypothetical protein